MHHIYCDVVCDLAKTTGMAVRFITQSTPNSLVSKIIFTSTAAIDNTQFMLQAGNWKLFTRPAHAFGII